MQRVYREARLSTDRVTKNGAILCQEGWNVVSGCNHHVNGFGVSDEDHARPFKYDVTEHAERDVILKACRWGVKTEGLTLVANWVACPDCARAIVLAGIADVVCHGECMDRTPERWREKVALGLDILKHSGVNLIV